MVLYTNSNKKIVKGVVNSNIKVENPENYKTPNILIVVPSHLYLNPQVDDVDLDATHVVVVFLSEVVVVDKEI